MSRRNAVDTTLWLAQLALLAGLLATFALGKPLSEAAQSGLFIGLALISMALGVVASVRQQSRKDEMEIAAARFGAQWGFVAGTLLAVLAVAFPPFQAWLGGILEWFETPGNGGTPPAAALFALGVAACLVVQATAQNLLASAWNFSKR